MTRSLRAHFDGKVLVLDEPADLPRGTPLKVEVTVESETTSSEPQPPREEPKRGILADLVDWVETLPIDPNSPGDAAAQHDHYLYGTPKRENP